MSRSTPSFRDFEGQSHAVSARERTPKLWALLWTTRLRCWFSFLWPGAGRDEMRADILTEHACCNGWLPSKLSWPVKMWWTYFLNCKTTACVPVNHPLSSSPLDMVTLLEWCFSIETFTWPSTLSPIIMVQWKMGAWKMTLVSFGGPFSTSMITSSLFVALTIDSMTSTLGSSAMAYV